MPNTLKKILALCLAAVLILGCFTACGNQGGQTETTAPVATENPEEAKVLKVLSLGHSLAVNACFMLNMVAHAEGYEEMKIGTLYYSGCPLSKHVQYLTNNTPAYTPHVSSTEDPNRPPEQVENMTMHDALKFDYWDVIVMMGGSTEIENPEGLTNGNIQTIQKYVNENKRNPNAVFAWNMPWPSATHPDLQNENGAKNYEKYNNDRRLRFAAFAENVKNTILPDETFSYLIPTGTAVENVISSYMTETDIICDYAHAGDFGRLVAAYVYFCVLTGKDKLEEIKVDAIPKKFVKTSVVSGDRVLSDADKALILEAVNNALANPLQITESQYKEAPEGYVQVQTHDG